MQYRFHVAVVFFIAIATKVSAFDSLHNGYWRDYFQDSIGNEDFECREVTNRDSLRRTLERTGWEKRGIPRIDWDRNYAVIISIDEPEIEFHGLFEDDGEINLAYSWGRLNGSSATWQDSSVPVRSVIVVSYPKGIDEGMEFYCRGRER